jgi:hypothetical protein
VQPSFADNTPPTERELRAVSKYACIALHSQRWDELEVEQPQVKLVYRFALLLQQQPHTFEQGASTWLRVDQLVLGEGPDGAAFAKGEPACEFVHH